MVVIPSSGTATTAATISTTPQPIQATSFGAEANTYYPIVAGAAISCTLPAAPPIGTVVSAVNYSTTAGANVTFIPGGPDVIYATANVFAPVLAPNGDYAVLVYYSSRSGGVWYVQAAGNITTL